MQDDRSDTRAAPMNQSTHESMHSGSASAAPASHDETAASNASASEPRTVAIDDEVRARNKPSGTHYVEPSPLGIEPVEQTGVDVQTNPPRSSERPAQTAEVPLGTGAHAEPPGGGGRESQQKGHD